MGKTKTVVWEELTPEQLNEFAKQAHEAAPHKDTWDAWYDGQGATKVRVRFPYSHVQWTWDPQANKNRNQWSGLARFYWYVGTLRPNVRYLCGGVDVSAGWRRPMDMGEQVITAEIPCPLSTFTAYWREMAADERALCTVYLQL